MNAEKRHDSETMPYLDDQVGALLLPPKPPPVGTVRLLLPEGCTWSVRQLAHLVQIDIVITTKQPRESWAAKLRRLMAATR